MTDRPASTGGRLRCPRLADLPPPPPGKTGWPWTVETPPLPPARPDGSPWPRISIVTPSYNQGRFIEETIRSVLLQGYPDLEYIIIDGGSTDQSVEIIKKYAPWLGHWVSEKDRGQSHALNKGFDRSTGIILGWLNSDDVLLPDALPVVAAAMSNPDEKALVAGASEYRDVSGTCTVWVVDRIPKTFSDVFSFFDTYFAQPSVFFTREAANAAGCLREDLHYAMDLDLWLRMARRARIILVDRQLSWMRQHKDAKTSRDTLRVLDEVERVLQPHSRLVTSRIVKRTYSLARRSRSRAWVAYGLSCIIGGDRRNGWLAAYIAARTRVSTVACRAWFGLVLRLVLPWPERRRMFRARAGS